MTVVASYCSSEIDNMDNSVMLCTLGNGLWEMGQMGNGVRMVLGLLGLWDRKCLGMREL